MSEIRDLHNRAMELTDEALAARKRGDRKAARDCFCEAARLEREALALATGESTIMILQRSAAALDVDCAAT